MLWLPVVDRDFLRTSALYLAQSETPNNKCVAATITAGLQDVRVLSNKMPDDVAM